MHSSRRTFLKQAGLGAAATSLGLFAPVSNCLAGHALKGWQLRRSTPEDQGVSSGGILDFLDALEHGPHELHSFMLLRHGQVIAEGWWTPYRANLNHVLYSLSKSFTSTAVGFAVADCVLKTSDLVVSFFPDDLPSPVSENLAALRVQDLLTMSVGHAEDSLEAIAKEHNWARAFLALPIPNRPGTHFVYNSGATYMLSAIVQKVTSQKLIDYLRPKLFEPLGITSMTWETCPRGINTGGWGLSVPTEGLARFGQLYLRKGICHEHERGPSFWPAVGRWLGVVEEPPPPLAPAQPVWEGQRLLPAAWVQETTTFKIQQPAPPGVDLEALKQKSDWHQGYCYQFWRCRHNAFRGDGAFGQFTIVMPDQDAVVVITSESPNLQAELDLVWDHLLPAMKDAPLPADHFLRGRLRDRLARLALPPTRTGLNPSVAAAISGRYFLIEPNPMNVRTVCFDFEKHSCRFLLSDTKDDYTIECGLERWVEGETSMPGTPPRLTPGGPSTASHVAASGAWKDPNTFEMIWRFTETPHHDIVTCRFDARHLKIEFLNSITSRLVPSRLETRPVLKGTLEGKA